MFVLTFSVAAQDGELAEIELQDGFRDLRLGMQIEETKAALLSDPTFRYRGDPDVSFLPSTGIPIIETDGAAFVRHAIFQFRNDELYSITLQLDERRLDYFGVYQELASQYGEPDALDPSSAIWESDVVRISLEKPLTVKYLDIQEHEAMIEAGKMEESIQELTRERFLDQL